MLYVMEWVTFGTAYMFVLGGDVRNADTQQGAKRKAEPAPPLACGCGEAERHFYNQKANIVFIWLASRIKVYRPT